MTVTGGGENSAYRQAGVDIDAGAHALDLMKSAVRSTFTPQVLADVGLFGGLFALGEGPDGTVLVSSTDSVGTKLKLSTLLGTYDLLGHDIVNHCTNDILCCGARPLFFLDYFAAAKLVPEQVAQVVSGMAEACRAVGCALVGGETAELPGVYADGEFDVVGFIVGSVRRDKMLLGDRIGPGDALLALPSSGLHTNGYSLARRALGLNGPAEESRRRLLEWVPALGRTLGDALTAPHRSYLNAIAPLLDLPHRPVKGLAHITGGGLIDNIPRILPEGCAVKIEPGAWLVPPLFEMIQAEGGISDMEMRRVFNLGIGMALVVASRHATEIMESVPGMMRIGSVIAHPQHQRPEGRVLFTN